MSRVANSTIHSPMGICVMT